MSLKLDTPYITKIDEFSNYYRGAKFHKLDVKELFLFFISKNANEISKQFEGIETSNS